MKRILCFGDSNTWGYSARDGARFDENTRWPCVMQKLLGGDYSVIEEGFNGRTCVYDDPIEGRFKSGLAYLPPCAMTHSPLDLVIIMLGTNDTKKRFGMTAFTIGGAVTQLIIAAKTYALNARGESARILIVSPAYIGENVMETRHAPIFGEDSVKVSRELGAELKRVSKLMRTEFLDAGELVSVSEIDAVHITPEGHSVLARAMCDKVKSIIG